MRPSHFAWNFGGLAIPVGVALLVVPGLVDRLGPERFGLLALAWGLIGHAGVMDLGVGRALTHSVAQLRASGDFSLIGDVLATAVRLTLLTGLCGALLIWMAALSSVHEWFSMQNTSVEDLRFAMLLLAMALPAQSMSATYRGFNEAFLNFRGISILRVGLGTANFAGPYFVSLFSSELTWLFATIVVSRLLALSVYRRLAIRCLRDQSGVSERGQYSAAVARALFAFGGWVTVSSLISPILGLADRFTIASVISAAAVSIYVLPYELVVQSLILVGAVSSVMFPGLTGLIREEPDKWRAYFGRWLRRVACMMAFVCISMVALLPTLLPLWLTDNVHPESVVVGQVLCIGVFANSLGSMFYAALHARGRADLTAKLHVIELPIYLFTLMFLVYYLGVQGAAWAWSGRLVLDAVVLALLSRRDTI